MSLSKEEVMQKTKDFIKDFRAVLGDAGIEAFNSVINNEVAEALAFERKRQNKRIVKTLYEAKVDEKEIIKLLHEYWELEEHEANELLRIVKTVDTPLKLLRAYLQQEGYKPLEIREYIEKNNIKNKLESNSTLWKLSTSPEKLMKEVEKKQ